MSGVKLGVGFLPLVDSAPLIVAQELGFAAEEGLSFDLRKAASWSMQRDMLAMGQIDAAHMLAPVPVAQALGLAGSVRMDVLSVLSVNGTVVGVSRALADKLRGIGFKSDFRDADAAGRALIEAGGDGLRIGVPFPFSMHAELLYYWLTALGLPAPQGVQIRTVPPPLMADALAGGEIDAFCVGEPWGSFVVELGVGELLLPGARIWGFAPEKVLAVRHNWAETEPDLSARLIRSVWRAGRWLDQPENRMMTSEILSRSMYLDVAAEVIERALSGEIVLNGRGDEIQCPDFMVFHRDQATFPWLSQAAWIGGQLASRVGLDREAAERTAARVFRTDLYRAAMKKVGGPLPDGDAKAEGHPSILSVEAEAEMRGAFFDRRIFNLSHIL